MRVFIACLGTETNTFSSLPTGEQTYRDTAYFDGDATRQAPTPFSLPLHIWRERAEAEGHEVVEGLCAFAQPAGRTIRRVYEDYRDRILAQAQAARRRSTWCWSTCTARWSRRATTTARATCWPGCARSSDRTRCWAASSICIATSRR